MVSCQTVTIKPDGGERRYSTIPTYEKSQSFFLGGLIGEGTVNVSNVCRGLKVMQMQTQATFLNQLVGVLTVGIFTPRTVKVWCSRR